MAYEFQLVNRTFEAAADLSALQYRFVVQDGNDRVNVPTASGAEVEGVLQNNPNALGKAATVAVGGISKVEAGAAIAVGNPIASDAQGRAVAAATGNVVHGYARTAASAAGILVSVELTQPYVRVA